MRSIDHLLESLNGGQDDTRILARVKNQTHEMCLQAVAHEPEELNSVRGQTPEICMEAIKRKGVCLYYVNEKIPNILDLNNPEHQAFYELGWRDGDLEKLSLVAVKNDGHALAFVKLKTQEICMAAINKYGCALQHIDQATPNKIDFNNPAHQAFYAFGWRDGDLDRICLAAIKKDSRALEFVTNQTDDLCLLSIEQSGLNLKYVKNQSPELCLTAVQQNGSALMYVKDLHSIADKINQEIIIKGLNSSDNDVVEAYQKLVKIRESNAIAKRINDEVDGNKSRKPKVKL